MTTLKKPKRKDIFNYKNRDWNQAIDEYETYLADLLKEVRENLGKYDECPNPVHLCLTIEAIRVLIGRVDNE